MVKAKIKFINLFTWKFTIRELYFFSEEDLNIYVNDVKRELVCQN